jgi:hypothetical protein
MTGKMLKRISVTDLTTYWRLSPAWRPFICC